MTVRLTIPDLGDFNDVEVIEVLVAPGDTVAVEDPLITLETDKASMDVPAEQAGEVVSVDVSVGDQVSQGDAVVTIEPMPLDVRERVPPIAPIAGFGSRPVRTRVPFVTVPARVEISVSDCREASSDLASANFACEWSHTRWTFSINFPGFGKTLWFTRWKM